MFSCFVLYIYNNAYKYFKKKKKYKVAERTIYYDFFH